MPNNKCASFNRVLIFTMLLTLFAWLPAVAEPVRAAEKMPGLDAKVTKKNIQKILNKYDPDGAYVIKKQLAKGDDILQWYRSVDRIIDGINVMLHEETHGYQYSYAKYGKDTVKTAMFVGKKKTIHVPITKVYPSKKMAASIPKRLRTFRYDTYVGKPTKNLSSNVNGAYGLMDEFTAYRMGMSNNIALFPYYVSQNADWSAWETFITECESDKLAYGEFKYYILHYLYYAKKHHPKVYKGIVGNKKFCQAYRRLESSYAKLIKDYEGKLSKIQQLMAKKGYDLEITADTVTISMEYGDDDYMESGGSYSYGIGRHTADYKKLQKETQKSRYKSIHKKLVKNGK